jgi:hypothetical protein
MYVLKQQGETVWTAPVTGSGTCNGPDVAYRGGIEISTFSC